MKLIANAASSRHGKTRPKATETKDLFEFAREVQQARNPAISKLARRYGLSVARAALVAQLSGLGGAQHG